jgi:hypothetical protein
MAAAMGERRENHPGILENVRLGKCENYWKRKTSLFKIFVLKPGLLTLYLPNLLFFYTINHRYFAPNRLF